jgi:ribulose kinase
MTGGNKNSFKILNNKQINESIHEKIKNDENILSLIKKMFIKNTSNSKKSLVSNTNKINYLKATSTEEYYKKINSKKSIK